MSIETDGSACLFEDAKSAPHSITSMPQITKGEACVGRNHRIADWNPEDTVAWEAGGNKIARRQDLGLLAVLGLLLRRRAADMDGVRATPGTRSTCAGSTPRSRAHAGVIKSPTGAMRQQLLGNAPEISQA